jgi:tetratricopeptide (TPR) repeat protein
MRSAQGRRIPVDAILVASLCTLGAVVHQINRALEPRVVDATPSGDVGPLPDGTALRVLSLGFDRLVADLFWLRTIYYVGDERSQAAGYPAVGRLANLVTDIDPSFASVYVVMSGAISGLQGDPDGAIALLEKGVQHVDQWKLHFLLGFDYFIEKLDYARAAREMESAARLSAGDAEAPPYLPLLVARLYASAGDRETALAFIQARLREEPEAEMRKALEKRYWDLWVTRDLAAIDAAIAEYQKRTGRAPLVLEELVRGGLLDPEPRDPRGGHYRIEGARAVTDLEYDSLQMHRPYSAARAPSARGALPWGDRK